MIKYLSFFLVFFCTKAVYAQIDWRGHHRLIATHGLGSGGDDDWEASFSQVLLNHRSEVLLTKNEHSFELAYELYGVSDFYQNKVLSRNIEERFLYRAVDLNYFLSNQKQDDDHYIRVIQNLDRFFYTFSYENIEVNLGRQPIAFGSARFINPLDILVPFGFTVINTEQRLGVDAFRFKYGFSTFGLFEIGGAFDEKLKTDEQYRFVSVREKINTLDLQIIFQELKKHKLYGMELQADLWNWGVYLDYAWVNTFAKESFYSYSLGGQYHFKNDLDFMVEYHLNNNDNAFVNQDLSVFITGNKYLNLGIGYLVTPLKSLSFTLINNLEDESKLLSTQYQYNFKENWYSEIGLFYGLGEGDYEFASYGQTLFFGIKSFF